MHESDNSNHKSEHWNRLASELGANVDDTAAQPPPPPPRPAEPRKKTAPPPSRGADWTALAADLGALPVDAVDAGTIEGSVLDAPSENQDVDPFADTVISHRQDSSSVVASNGGENEGTEASDDEGGESSERRPRRRRRRRRRGRRGRETADDAGPTDEDAMSTDPTSDNPFADSIDGEDEGLTEPDSEEPATRPTGRRRRRRGQGRSERTAPHTAATDANDPLEMQTDLDDDLDEVDQDDNLDVLDEEKPDGGTGHRNIPNWGDAIGIIVDTNLESRARSPARTAARGRGRGRGRGGRGRGRTSSTDSPD